MGALSNLKVLDLSRILAGPWASQMLGDLGAEVIKIERPGSGDDTRSWGPPFMSDRNGEATKESAYFLAANRNKQSVAIDLKSPEGQQQIRELAASCDIVIENFKAGDTANYGLDYATLSKLNPRLVYCSITGFGQTGPMKDRPGYDFLVQAMGGLMSITGQPDGSPGAEPMKVGVALTDIMTGLYATVGILAAINEREQSGLGQYVDLSLLDVTVATLANQASNYLVGGVNAQRLGNAHPNIVPYQSMVTANGHLIIAVGNDGQFKRYVETLELAHLADDPRFSTNPARVANRDALIPLLQARMLEKTTSEWLSLLAEAGIPSGPINSIKEVFAEPQVQAREMQITVPHSDNPDLQLVGNPIKLSRTPVEYRSAPPVLGEHSAQILQQLASFKQDNQET
jgi:crotonobetainyl-CoA:carnitine CoA-transferase CaiB-like acyl-CoA transferase